MNRKDFIKTCGYSCLGSLTLGPLLQSCTPMKMITGTIEGEDILVQLSDFKVVKKEEVSFRKYLIVQNELLQFPICVYRVSETEYSALWMKCTHQGNELTAFGDKLHCSAHGSEFDKHGNVTNGPAANQLRTFEVIIENEQLKISLKAV